MRIFFTYLAVAILSLLPATSQAEGLLYQLPEDGSWARFKIEGNTVQSDGSERVDSGTMTISSVGTAVADGKPCRWIEIVWDRKSSNLKSYTEIYKLLIPKEHLVKGKEPLKHVLIAWEKNTLNKGEARKIEDLQGTGAEKLKQKFGMFLHGPFESAEKLDKAPVESKLGSIQCEGITANEKIELKSVTSAKKDITVTFDVIYTIRLHEKAPFGVVTCEFSGNLEVDGKHTATAKAKLTLSDFGKDATSKIPDAR